MLVGSREVEREKNKKTEMLVNSVKIHKITPAQGKERGDLELKRLVFLGFGLAKPPRTG